MIRTRSRLTVLALSLVALAALASTPARAAYIMATCQSCTAPGPGECETAPSVFGAGTTASMSRLWNSAGFAFATDTNMTLDYVSLSAFASASGFENPENGGPSFINIVAYTARSIGHIDDVLTAGEGGTPGFFRIPLHVTGGTAISWQNGGGNALLAFQCVSSVPGSQLAIGHCPLQQFNFTGDESFDTVIDIDVPIVLGQEFEYRITVTIQATTCHGFGDLIPFQGAAEASFGSEPFAGALVLDASHAVIPDAPISASESGFVYVPEPSSAASGALALAVVLSLRRRA
jgi:hypothetical protein